MPNDFLFWSGLAVVLAAIIAAIIALVIDFLNARRSIRDRKYEILSQISQKSYHGYRSLRSHISHHYNLNYYIALTNNLNTGVINLTNQLAIKTDEDQKEKIKYELKLKEISRATWTEEANYHRAERQKVHKSNGGN